MPRYEVRLEDKDSGEFRITTLVRDSEDEARWFCEDRERKTVAFRLDLSDKEIQRRQELAPGDPEYIGKGQALAHAQTKPYKVVKIREAEKS